MKNKESVKEKLNEEKSLQEIENYVEGINWIEDNFFNSWNKIKGKNIKQLKQDGEKMFLLLNSSDTIKGKPQLIQDIKQTIPLITKVEKKDKEGEISITYKFIDDRYDRRYDGHEVESLEQTFLLYKIIDNGEEFIVFSEKELENQLITFKGIKIRLPNLSDLSKNLKIRSISKIFIVKEHKNSIQTLNKKELINLTKKLNEKYGMDKEKFIDFTFSHPDGNIYRHSNDYNLIRIIQLLSGKFQGYPLHCLNMGPLGKGKTCELEALNYKFNEDSGILEAGNSTPKVLIPSFKEKPANVGYVIRCVRIGLIDELMKMVHNSQANARSGEMIQQHLSQLNMLLEHKERTIGSGNDNTLKAKSTSKLIFATNPLPKKMRIGYHVGVIDESTLSRMLIWVQDVEEQNFIQRNILKSYCPHTPNTKSQKEGSRNSNIVKNSLEYCYGVGSNIYITIYDSCNDFLCKMDLDRIKRIKNSSLIICKEPMKSIWDARGFHHSVLILDGICKFRCLFEDFDKNFKPKDSDYDELERLIFKMIKTWDTNLNINDSGWKDDS